MLGIEWIENTYIALLGGSATLIGLVAKMFIDKINMQRQLDKAEIKQELDTKLTDKHNALQNNIKDGFAEVNQKLDNIQTDTQKTRNRTKAVLNIVEKYK
jgi:uncharacterized membrane-anchored protein YhcB (DUF1043 family)